VPAGWTGSSPFPAGWRGSGRSPAVLAGDPVLFRPKRLDPGGLAGIRPFSGQNGRILAEWPGSGPSQARTAGIRPLSPGKGQNGWPEVGGRGKMEGGGGEEIRREKKKMTKYIYIYDVECHIRV